MKQFIIKLIAGSVLLIIIDISAGLLFDKLFTNLPETHSRESVIYRSLFKKTAGVLVLGSSSANHHYNTKILDDSLGVSSFNAGLDGLDIIYSDIVFQSFLERNTPKYVIIDVGTSNLNGVWKKRIGSVAKYYGKNKSVTDYYNKDTDWKQLLKLKSNIFRYNSSLHVLIGTKLFNRKMDITQGYRPLHGSNLFDYELSQGFIVDSTCLQHLNHIVYDCKNNNTYVIIVKSPHCVYNADFIDWLEQYGKSNNIPVILECNDEYWRKHPELFYDGSHLNELGADILTKRICNFIKLKN